MHTLKMFIDKKTPIVLTGVSFCAETVSKAEIGDIVEVWHEQNEYDPNALRVVNSEKESLGYIPKKIAERIVQENSKKIGFIGHVSELRTYKSEVVGLSILLDESITPS